MKKFIRLQQTLTTGKTTKTAAYVYVDPSKISLMISRIGTPGTDQMVVELKTIHSIKESPQEIFKLAENPELQEEIKAIKKPRRARKATPKKKASGTRGTR